MLDFTMLSYYYHAILSMTLTTTMFYVARVLQLIIIFQSSKFKFPTSHYCWQLEVSPVIYIQFTSIASQSMQSSHNPAFTSKCTHSLLLLLSTHYSLQQQSQNFHENMCKMRQKRQCRQHQHLKIFNFLVNTSIVFDQPLLASILHVSLWSKLVACKVYFYSSKLLLQTYFNLYVFAPEFMYICTANAECTGVLDALGMLPCVLFAICDLYRAYWRARSSSTQNTYKSNIQQIWKCLRTSIRGSCILQ